MIDLHVHSHFSSDCEEQMEDMIKEAINKKIQVIAITDHIDYDYKDPTINFDFDVAVFLDEIRKLKSKYRKKIKILVGLELGLQEHITEKLEDLTNQYAFDFIIGSFHTVDSKDLYRGDFYIGRTSEEAWDIYLDEVYSTLLKFDNFSVLGHLDLIKRYNEGVRGVELLEYKEKLEKIFRLIVKKNIGLEVNTSGLRKAYGLNETLPSTDILQIYYNCGGRIITIGSDSHTKDTLACEYEGVKKMLEEIGFEDIYIFEKMKPIKYNNRH
ncbi:MAG TPA: histidinol-phosphatase HisJ family protein [Clostridia bacterium]|nr:histidinol-phosphatase HisJ family protein [Clostridia bacterium]